MFCLVTPFFHRKRHCKHLFYGYATMSPYAEPEAVTALCMCVAANLAGQDRHPTLLHPEYKSSPQSIPDRLGLPWVLFYMKTIVLLSKTAISLKNISFTQKN